MSDGFANDVSLEQLIRGHLQEAYQEWLNGVDEPLTDDEATAIGEQLDAGATGLTAAIFEILKLDEDGNRIPVERDASAPWTCGDVPCGATGGSDKEGPEACDHAPCGWSCR